MTVTISSNPTDAGQQAHLSAGRAEPWQELHPLQAQYWEAEPAREPGQSAQEVPTGRWESNKHLPLGRGSLTRSLLGLLVAPLGVRQSCGGSIWVSWCQALHLKCELGVGQRKIPAPVCNWLILLQVLPEEAKEHWESCYQFSLKKCNHAVW